MRSPHLRGAVRPRCGWPGLAATLFALAVGSSLAAQQIIPGNNVNMVSGAKFPDGDPFLQRQNEPSMAVSTRNPLHLLAGANDYRTVDLPGPFDPLRGEKTNADAWLGLFKSLDGGRTWTSTLLPGFPQDASATGLASPIKGRQAATDSVVRAGTNGLFYYAGLAFDRGVNAPSTIFVARFIDNNNRESGDPISYLGTQVIDADTGARFLDKTALAVDIPRSTATCTIPTTLDNGTVVNQTIPSGNVYVAYSSFTGTGASQQSQILFSRSTNCGVTWSAPKNLSIGHILNQNAQIAISPSTGHIWVSWRRFQAGTLQSDGIFITRSTDGGNTFSRPVRVAPTLPFDQGTTNTSFRTNSFQSMTVDAAGRVYVAWPERGHATQRPDIVTGDSRIVISTSTNGSTWTAPTAIDATGLGHQLMPTLTFHGGKLRLLYYDLREDVSGVFEQFVDELSILNSTSNPKPPRHTIDAFVAQALPAAQPVFTAVRLSDYAFGTLAGSTQIERLQYNPPNLPLFRQGTAPFLGDYIDLAPAPPFVQAANGAWQFNIAPTSAAVSHGVWTDNRDVRAPLDGDWTNYTPVMSESLGTISLFDPTQTVPPCFAGQTGMRNQNIYTAKVTEGLFVGSPGNAKPLGAIQRGFVVIVENARPDIRSYRLQILNQPTGGVASFLQFGAGGATPLTTIDVSLSPFSTIARTVYVTSTATFAQVQVQVAEIVSPGAPSPIAGGQSSTIILNGDPTNPSIQNPSIQNPSIQNPDITVAEVYNPAITTAFLAPSIQNPSIQNPSIQNPSIQNPSIQNPDLSNDAIANPGIIAPSIQNPSIQNPSIQNPSIQNPSIQNQDLVNGAIQDTSWQITNDGNTAASYAIKLLANGALPTGFKSQLVLHKTYKTPAAQDCTLAQQPHTVVIANIPDPTFTQVSNVTNPSIQNPSIQNATLSLAPGESANVTLRIVDPNRYDGVEFDAGAAIVPAVVAHSVNTTDAAQGITTPPVAIPMTITTGGLAAGSPGGAYSASLQTFASSGSTTWTVTQGTLPPGLTINPSTGQISGTPTTPGNYVFTVRAIDASGNVDIQTLAIKIDPVVPASFTKVWNGATNDWNNPHNWSPAGVPTATDSVYISASIAVMPVLTSDATIHDVVIEPGATLDTNGFTLTVLGNVSGGAIVGNGTVVMNGIGTAAGAFPSLTIEHDVWVAGPITLTGTLRLLTGATLNLNGLPLTVGGQLVTNAPTGPAPTIIGEAGLAPVTVAGLDVDGLTLSRVSLVVNGGALTRFDNVRFIDYQPQDEHLTLNHTGTPTPFAMSGLTFFTVPTTGHYIQANDTAADAQSLVVNVSASLPGDGSNRTATQGGAVVNWLTGANDASIGVVQFVDPNVAVVGSPLTYTILVRNGGPATATNVTLTNPLPAGASFVSATPAQGVCGFSANTVSCNLGSIAPLQTTFVDIVVVPNVAGSLNNAVSVTATESDPGTSDNSQTVSTPVFAATAAADLSITKTDSLDPVPQGSSFSYSLLVANAGPGTANSVLVLDTPPAGITAIAARSTKGVCTLANGTVTCQIASLAPGEQATITIDATASGFGILTNTAFVFSSVPDPNPANNGASETTVVGAVQGCTAATFRGPFTYGGPAGSVTQGHFADMDGDGDLDIVTTQQAPGNSVTVLLNNGDGTYGTPIVNFIGTAAFVGAIADFNGDGDLDMVVGVSGTPNTLRVLLGNGTGTLTQSGSAIPVSSGFFIESLDADGDGDRDIITRGTTNDLVLLKNTGGGAFDPPVSIYAGPVGLRAAIGDYNVDGRVDIVLARTDANFTILLGNGSGGFTASGDFVTAAVPRAVLALGDLNGDGHLDLGVAEGSSLSFTSRLTLRFGTGTGSFGPEVDVSPGNTSNSTVSADVNGDGKLDLVTNHAVRTAVSVQLGNGAGGFSAPGYFATTAFSNPAVGDVDGDGKPDILSGDEDGTIGILLNNCGRPTTELGVTVTESADPVNENDEIVYTLTVANNSGNAANNVVVGNVIVTAVNSTLPPNTTVTTTTTGPGGTLSSSPTDGVYFWQFPVVAADTTFTIEFRVRAQSGGTVWLTSTVTSDDADIDSTNNTTFESTTINTTGRDIVVTNTNDSGTGSLRQAITDSNGDTGDVDRIVFAIPGAGAHTIVPSTALPTITQPVIIDGTTQPGFSGAPLIELNGNGLAANGLNITAGGSTVRGLVINRFASSPGIRIQTLGGNVIAGNFIGTDITGTIARGNGSGGIAVSSPNNVIGGTSPADRNVVSGNTTGGIVISSAAATNNQVVGNVVGTDVTGAAAIPNTGAGILINNGATGNTIGGTAAGARNLISGNTAANGVRIDGTGSINNAVQGNYIGVNAAGIAALPNSTGVSIVIGPNTIGGTAAGAGNLIAGNSFNGIVVTGTAATGVLVQQNVIGLNASGNALTNGTGVQVGGPGNTIGGGAGNVISGNVTGILVDGTSADGNTIAGNTIGTDATGTIGRPNGRGIVVQNGADNNTIGGTTAAARNLISGNAIEGILISGSTASTTTVQGNYIGTNAAGTAAVPNAFHGVALSAGTHDNVIGGTAAGAGNVISGNGGNGIGLFAGSTQNRIQGNLIGTNATGNGAVPNQLDGVGFVDAPNNTLGGVAAGARNLISGNGRIGVGIFEAGATGNVVEGNFIGTDITGTSGLPNASNGVGIGTNNPANNRIGGTSAGEANVIAFNLGDGIESFSGTGNRLAGNSIFSNSGLGIDLQPDGVTSNDAGDADTGANNLQNFPVLTAAASSGGATTVDGSLNSAPSTTFRIEFFSSAACDAAGNGEGRTLVGFTNVTTDASGNTTFSASVAPAAVVTATATDPNGNTSEFSQCRSAASATTFVVTNTADSGAGSLRQAILSANANAPALDTIAFAISGAGSHSIALTSSLPPITDPVFIDGSTQPGYSGTPLIELNGANAGGGANGLHITAGGSTVRGLAINRFGTNGSGNGGAGIALIGAGGNIIEASFIGTDPTGTTALPNRTDGVWMDGPGNRVGGTTAAQRNVISGNTRFGVVITGSSAIANLVLGNYVGTNAGGTAAVPNVAGGIAVDGSGNFIGSTVNGSGNVVSGNGGAGITITGPGAIGNVVSRNYVGLNAAGTAAVPNNRGVVVTGAGVNIIGGDSSGPSAGVNVISGNTNAGIELATDATFVRGNTIGLRADFSAKVPNTGSGVLISGSNNIVGNAGAGSVFTNIITGNGGDGVHINAGSDSNVVHANLIGVNPIGGGSALTGNGSHGAFVAGSDNLIDGNDIQANGGDGVRVAAGTGNSILYNRISANAGLGIDLAPAGVTPNDAGDGDTGANDLQNHPVLTSAIAASGVTTIAGTLNSTPDSSFRVQVFTSPACDASGSGEGASGAQVDLFVDTDPLGNAVINVQLPFAVAVGSFVTATATDTAANTSEFSSCVAVTSGNNQPPVANAGPDQQVPVGSTVQLDGSASSDPETQPLTYTWILNTRPAGSAAVLSATNVVNPTFVADVPGTYIAQLVVNDGQINGPSDIVTITTLNQAPIARAGADQTGIPLGTTVNLNGNTSSDPDGQPVTYLWSIVLRPASSSATLFNATTATPSFVADSAGLYRIQLIVNDGLVDSAADTVDISTVNQAPIANAGADQSAPVGSTVQLNGSGSTDPDANPLTYSWSIVSRPVGSVAALSSTTVVSPTFVPDVTGSYTVRLVVNDGFTDSAPDTATITATTNVISMALVGTPLVGVSRQASLEVTLPAPAPVGGVVVTVTSDDTGIVTVGPPNTVTIAAGNTTGQVTLNGISAGTTIVRAAAPGYPSGAFTVTVTQNVLTVSTPLNVPFGQTASFPVNLSQPAPPGGLVIDLVSSAPGTVEVLTPTITVPQSAVSANGTVRGLGIGTATVTASNPNFSSAASQVSSTGNLNILQTSATFTPAFTTNLTIQLESGGNAVAAPPGGVSVTLTAANPACVSVPASVTILQGLTSTSVTLNYGGSATRPCTTTVTAGATTLTADTVNVTVNPDPSISINSTGSIIGAGLQNGFFSAILGVSNHGGVTMRIASSNPSVALVSPDATTAGTAFIDIPINNLSTSALYYLQGVEGATGTVTITASAPGFTDGTGSLTIVQPAIRIEGLPVSTTSLSSDSPFFVRTGPPIAGNGNLAQLQAVRAGGGITVTLTNSNATVAQLTTAAGSGQTRTVAIGPNQFNSATSVAGGGVAFDPIAGGSTTVSASAAGFISTTAASVSVTVTTPGITVNSSGAVVGAGLQDGFYSAVLGGANHGGVTMRIASTNPAVALVSPNSTTAGTPFIDVTINNLSTTALYYLQGVDGASGTATITASAPGFTSGSAPMTVVQPAIRIEGISTSTTALSADQPFFVRTGPPTAGNANLSQLQAVRAGGGVTVTLTNSNATVAQLTTSAGSGQTGTVIIGPSQFNSPTSVASGGVAFDPIAGGNTTVSATATGFISTTAASIGVTVTAPGITVNSNGAVVGAGLQDGFYSAVLGGSNHGGVTMRIASGNPAVALVSPDATTPGTAFIDVPIANQSTTALYYLQGVEGAAGTVTITASAPGFTAGSGTLNIVQPAIRIESLSTSTTSLSVDQPFFVRTGPPVAGNSNLAQLQAVRAGGGVTVTVTNSNASVAQLTTTAGSGQTRTVSIGPNQFNSPSSVVGGGVAFDPIAGGSTTVSATATGFISTAAASIAVTVTAPGITVNSNGAIIGAGLQDGLYSAVLGGSNHGGVTMRIASSNPAVALVSPNATTAGTPFIDVPIGNLSTTALYYLQGVEGATGTVTITASAPGFSDGSGTLTIVQPAIRIESLPTSTTSLSVDQPFFVRTGPPVAGNSNLAQLQAVRAGGGVTVTITNSNGTAAQLTTSAGPGQTRTVAIGPNQFNSPTSVATGGVAFDPITGGNTTVTATAPGYISTAAATVQVTVTAPGITVNSNGATIGAGLQDGFYSAVLGGANHGGVTMRIASSNPAVALVSPNSTTPGAPFIDVPIANLSTTALYYLQGVEGATGTVTITASAPQFVSGTGTLTIVQPALRIESLPASIDDTASNAPFFVRSGIADASVTFLQQFQSVRAGSSVLVTLQLNQSPPTPLVAQLVTTSGAAQSRTVTIAATQSNSPTSVAAGGVEFDPLQAGTTNVSASATNFIIIPAAGVQVDVTSALVGSSSKTKAPPKKRGGE
jgi:uncharacterized repeat protein (TIGR01451 family)